LASPLSSTAFLPALGEFSSLASQPLTDASASAKPVRLDQNESPYGPCDKAKEVCANAIADANRYPGQELDDLRAAIAALAREGLIR